MAKSKAHYVWIKTLKGEFVVVKIKEDLSQEVVGTYTSKGMAKHMVKELNKMEKKHA